MRNVFKFLGFILIPLLIVGCIKVELKDEREIPKFFEVALVTYTPSSSQVAPPTATATATPTSSPTPTQTSTPVPSQTQIASTPVFSALVNADATCRQGPGDAFPASGYLTAGETVTLVGRNPEATWWLIQMEDGAQICWVSNEVLTLQGNTVSVAIMSALPTATHPYLSQPTQSPTQKLRQKPPRATTVAPPGVTDTPAPYPYPQP